MSIQVPARNGGTLTRPAKGETMNPRGRPRRTLRRVIDEWKKLGNEPAAKADVKEIYEHLITLSKAEITKESENLNAPMIVRIVAKALLKEKQSFINLEAMLDRAHGKADEVKTHKFASATEEDLKKSIVEDLTEIMG